LSLFRFTALVGEGLALPPTHSCLGHYVDRIVHQATASDVPHRPLSFYSNRNTLSARSLDFAAEKCEHFNLQVYITQT
jgi:hypothetical protein